mgnify:CR=1 FL=1
MQKALNHYIKYVYFDDEEIECLPLKIDVHRKESTIIKERIVLKNKNYDILPIHIHEAKLNLAIQELKTQEDCKPYLKRLSVIEK